MYIRDNILDERLHTADTFTHLTYTGNLWNSAETYTRFLKNIYCTYTAEMFTRSGNINGQPKLWVFWNVSTLWKTFAYFMNVCSLLKYFYTVWERQDTATDSVHLYERLHTSTTFRSGRNAWGSVEMLRHWKSFHTYLYIHRKRWHAD